MRESLALLLLTLLPFHALLVTVGTKMIAGPGHAPLPLLALWKEGLLALILLIALTEIISHLTSHISHLKQFDLSDILILSLVFLTFILPTTYSLSSTTWLHGFRYDFVPLLFFLILRRVPWSDRFKRMLPLCLLGIGAFIAFYGIISFFLPSAFFTWLGYSDLHSLYVPDGPVAAFQQIGSTNLRRIQSTLSGPNHLGLWLLIPISILLSKIVLHAVTGGAPRTTGGVEALPNVAKQKIDAIKGCSATVHPHEGTFGGDLVRGDFFFASFFCMADKRKKACIVTTSILAILFAVALLLTFSRAAWIGGCAITIITLLHTVPRKSHTKVFIPLSLFALACAVLLTFIFPTTILRLASSRDHFLRPLEAIRTMIDHPLGLGLGTAGPASNRTSDACVFLEAGSDPAWANDRPDLCVFVDNIQVQPLNRTCHCPFLPENWYLQIGVELGWIGFLLFLMLTLTILYRTHGGMRLDQYATNNHFAFCPSDPTAGRAGISHFALLAFISISLASLFLHAWEDMATALTVWILMALALPSGTIPPWRASSHPNPSSSSTSADNMLI